MNGGKCPGCSQQSTLSYHCGQVPPNLVIVQRALKKPKYRRKCLRKCNKCVVKAAGGDSVDCLCNISTSTDTKSDHRLKCWERELALRNALAERLMQRTGKSFCELLFNRPVTVDVRDKEVVQRLLAHAESRKPYAPKNAAVIKERLPDGSCIMELSSARPTAKKYFEITGLPAGIKCELIGENCCVRRSGWITSKTVRERIAAKRNDIKRVLPFFPDIEFLQVIGKKMLIYSGFENIEERIPIECPCSSAGSSSLNSSCALIPNGCNFESCYREEIVESVEDERISIREECSDNDFDFYSELICNRAKCHDLFYKL